MGGNEAGRFLGIWVLRRLPTAAAAGSTHVRPCAPHAAAPPAGIGYACAQALGRAGARVIVADIDAEAVGQAEQQLQAEGIEAASTVCDVGDKQQVGAGSCSV